MRIDLQDDNQNWLNWGNLVNSWIDGASRPTTVRELKTQLTANNVIATVAGADDRVVEVESYYDDPTHALVIVIPTSAMREAKLGRVHPGPYPLPLFYDTAYAGAARANLSAQESHDFAMRRIGEYTVNECC
jgi:hypothetical protein